MVRVTLGFAALFGIVNRYVLEFKGNPFMPSEISAAGTALGVLSGYELHLTNGMVRGGLLLLLALALIAGLIYMLFFKKYHEATTLTQKVKVSR